MSVASEITRIQNAKASLKTSINAKTDAQHQIGDETIDDYADFVDSITTGGGSELPDGYTLVSYIESSRTQYINLNYIPNVNTKFEIKCSQIVGEGALPFGAKETTAAGNVFYSLASNSSKPTFYYNVATILKSNLTTGDFVDLKVERTKITFNGTEYTGMSIDTFPSYSLILFGQNENGTPSSLSSIKMGRVKIYENDTLIRNLIPCYRNSDNVVGMFDVVNNVFYTNNGTGTFSYMSSYI